MGVVCKTLRTPRLAAGCEPIIPVTRTTHARARTFLCLLLMIFVTFSLVPGASGVSGKAVSNENVTSIFTMLKHGESMTIGPNGEVQVPQDEEVLIRLLGENIREGAVVWFTTTSAEKGEPCEELDHPMVSWIEWPYSTVMVQVQTRLWS